MEKLNHRQGIFPTVWMKKTSKNLDLSTKREHLSGSLPKVQNTLDFSNKSLSQKVIWPQCLLLRFIKKYLLWTNNNKKIQSMLPVASTLWI